MLEEKDVTPSSVVLRDEDGAVRADFVERVAQAITTGIPRRCASWSASCIKLTSAM